MKSPMSLSFGQSFSVKRAATLLAVASLFSNVLGLLRNALFYRFIPAEQLDVYYASFRLPDLIFNILVIGAIASAFVPIISELVASNKKERAVEVTNQFLTRFTLVFAGVAVLLALAMPAVMHVIVPGFEGVRFDQAVFLTRILLFQSVCFLLGESLLAAS